MPPIAGEWAKALQGEFRKPYYKKLFTIVGEEYRTKRIYPPADDIFNAFHFTPLDLSLIHILSGVFRVFWRQPPIPARTRRKLPVTKYSRTSETVK